MSHLASLLKSRSGGGCHKINGYTFVNLTTHHILFLDTPQLFHNSSMDPHQSLTAGEFWAWQQTDCVKIASVSNCYQHLAQTFSISPHSGNSVFPTQPSLFGSQCPVFWLGRVCNELCAVLWAIIETELRRIRMDRVTIYKLRRDVILWPLIGPPWSPLASDWPRLTLDPLKRPPRPQLSAIRHHPVPRSCCWVSHFISVTTLLLQWCAEWQDASGDNPFKLRLCLKLRLNPTREKRKCFVWGCRCAAWSPSIMRSVSNWNQSLITNNKQVSCVNWFINCIITKLIGTK